jgi:hypothetical protein
MVDFEVQAQMEPVAAGPQRQLMSLWLLLLIDLY